MSDSPSALISARIAELTGWRGAVLARIREIVLEADPEIVEEWKWRGVPTWSRGGIICTGETYKSVVKMTFAKGASLPDPAGLFNASLAGNARRAIAEGRIVDPHHGRNDAGGGSDERLPRGFRLSDGEGPLHNLDALALPARTSRATGPGGRLARHADVDQPAPSGSCSPVAAAWVGSVTCQVPRLARARSQDPSPPTAYAPSSTSAQVCGS